MKILIIQDHLRNGGTERQSVLLANALAAGGHPTTLLTFRPGGTLDGTVDGAVTRTALQRFDFGLDWFAPGLDAAVARARADVILCMGRMANCYGCWLQRATQRHALPGTVVATMRTGKKLPWAFRRSLRAVSHVVANSHEARDTLVRDHRIAAGKITVIHNSLVFPPESAVGRDETLRAQHAATPATAVLLCVAMFRPEKNQRGLIETVAGLPAGYDWQLWLAGDGPARPACEQLVADRGLGGRVKFLGFHRDPSPLYRAADLAVHASWSEALSNFLIEAQAHGLPVVAFDAQGIRECFVPGRTGWSIARGDHAAFLATITDRMKEPAATRRERAAEARAYARAMFDPAHQVAAYLDLFARLLANKA